MRVGDNLVVVTTGDVGIGWLTDRFIAASDSDRLIVVDGNGRHAPHGAGTVLDWSAGSRGSRPVAWGPQPSLDLFLWACPRLYRRRSAALWIVDADRHDDGFMRKLTEITQVVVRVRTSEDKLVLEVVKADGRGRSVQGRALEARLVDGDLVDARPIGVARQRLGEWLRELRSSRGVGQAELACRVGISPSALSQAERGVGRVSAETLMRIWEELGVPLGPQDTAGRGYRVARRTVRNSTAIAPGVTGRQLSNHAAAAAWHLTVAPRASGRNPIFAVKTPEVITVLRGVLQFDIGGAG